MAKEIKYDIKARESDLFSYRRLLIILRESASRSALKLKTRGLLIFIFEMAFQEFDTQKPSCTDGRVRLIINDGFSFAN